MHWSPQILRYPGRALQGLIEQDLLEPEINPRSKGLWEETKAQKPRNKPKQTEMDSFRWHIDTRAYIPGLIIRLV